MHLDHLEHHIMHYQSTLLPLIKSFYNTLSLDGFVGKITIFSAKLVNMPSLVDVAIHLTPHLAPIFACTWSTKLSESLHILLVSNGALSLLHQPSFGGKKLFCSGSLKIIQLWQMFPKPSSMILIYPKHGSHLLNLLYNPITFLEPWESCNPLFQLDFVPIKLFCHKILFHLYFLISFKPSFNPQNPWWWNDSYNM